MVSVCDKRGSRNGHGDDATLTRGALSTFIRQRRTAYYERKRPQWAGAKEHHDDGS